LSVEGGSFLLLPGRLECVKVRAHVLFEGLVQGVFFRANTKKCADALKLTGWVRNTYDGRVEAVFEGEEEKVRQAIEWCASKQPHAKVDGKEVEFSEAKDEFEDFAIRY
jgi:acylphosphatase